MIDTTAFFEDASESLSRYERKAGKMEQWKKEHDDAMKCFRLEEVLAFGLSIYHFINQVDENWRIKVHRNLVSYDAGMENAIADLYRWWLKPCGHLLSQIEAFERNGFDVTGAKEFLSASREVKGILTADAEFFADDGLTRLKDAALEDHSQGKTEEFLAM